jgi:hypothetical protein
MRVRRKVFGVLGAIWLLPSKRCWRKMSSAYDDEELVPVSVSSRATQEDATLIAKAVQATDSSWLDGEVITFNNGLRWRPSLVQQAPPAVLYVHLLSRVPNYILDRLVAAVSSGYKAHLALPLSALYEGELVEKLVGIDAAVHVLDGMEPSAPRRTLLAIARRDIRVEPTRRTNLAVTGWSLARQAVTNDVKGRRLEALVAFLLSQVSDLRVIDTNLRTETEELDVVVQRRGLGSFCWSFSRRSLYDCGMQELVHASRSTRGLNPKDQNAGPKRISQDWATLWG